MSPGVPNHHRVSQTSVSYGLSQFIVIDFEYAAPNPRGYDIANHFHEWRANYHHPTHAHSLQPHFPYPTQSQREAFYRAYLSVQMDPQNGQEVVSSRQQVSIARTDALEREVRIWSPASSVFWALWGIVQAQDQVASIIDKTEGSDSEFDYLVSQRIFLECSCSFCSSLMQ